VTWHKNKLFFLIFMFFAKKLKIYFRNRKSLGSLFRKITEILGKTSKYWKN